MARKNNGDPKTFAYEEFMARARKEGRVRNESLALSSLTLDASLQARVKQLDMDNVRKLNGILADGFELSPVVVFEVEDGGRTGRLVADGFHRCEVYRRAGRAVLPATIVRGVRQEAIEYATSCNRTQCLGRTKADAAKATRMLLESGWSHRSARALAEHTGLGLTSTLNIINEWFAANGIEKPPSSVNIRGTAQAAKVNGGIVRRIKSEDGDRWMATYLGRVFTSVDIEAVQNWLDSTRAKVESRTALISSTSALKQTLARRGLVYETRKTGGFNSIFGGKVGPFAISSCPEFDGGGNGSEQAGKIAASIGKAVLLAGHFGCKRIVVLIPNSECGFKDLRDGATRAGVEFMTLDEFVAAAKAEQRDSAPVAANA